jgi:hypothetical protein
MPAGLVGQDPYLIWFIGYSSKWCTRDGILMSSTVGVDQLQSITNSACIEGLVSHSPTCLGEFSSYPIGRRCHYHHACICSSIAKPTCHSTLTVLYAQRIVLEIGHDLATVIGCQARSLPSTYLGLPLELLAHLLLIFCH